MRRGNDTADHYANLGRAGHEDITSLFTTTKARYDTAKSWAKWLGGASQLQYGREVEACDHELEIENKSAKCKGASMPWAKYSLGTVEYMQGLCLQDERSHGVSDRRIELASVLQAANVSKGSVSERASLHRFHRNVNKHSATVAGERFLPRTEHSELNEYLLSDAALGHIMMTAGIHEEQYYWCNICVAYTRKRAQKLIKACERFPRTALAVGTLRRVVHPARGTNLISQPRRLWRTDIGRCTWSGDGNSDHNVRLIHQAAKTRAGNGVDHRFPFCFDEDEEALRLGLCFD